MIDGSDEQTLPRFKNGSNFISSNIKVAEGRFPSAEDITVDLEGQRPQRGKLSSHGSKDREREEPSDQQ